MNPFFTLKPNVMLLDIAAVCNISVLPLNNQSISGFAPLGTAKSSEISFFHNPKYRDALKKTQALACFIAEEYVGLLPQTTIPLITPAPYRALAQALGYAYLPVYERFDGVWTQQGFFLGKGAQIGVNVQIGPGSIIGPGVQIGEDSCIGARAVIENAIIGTHCQIGSGAIIGDKSLSFDRDPSGRIDVPQIGCVRMGNHVCVSPQSLIDRGSLQDTLIGDDVIIGALVQIGHNVKIGKGVTIVSQVGVAGSTQIDDFTIIGGQAGIAGHLHIGAGVQIAGQSGVAHDVLPYTKMAGTPAVDANLFKRQMYNLNRLGQTHHPHESKNNSSEGT